MRVAIKRGEELDGGVYTTRDLVISVDCGANIGCVARLVDPHVSGIVGMFGIGLSEEQAVHDLMHAIAGHFKSMLAYGEQYHEDSQQLLDELKGFLEVKEAWSS